VSATETAHFCYSEVFLNGVRYINPRLTYLLIYLLTYLLTYFTFYLLMFVGMIVASEAVEYCQFETFNATCPPDHVIMMEHAQYGRPRTGRCIARDYGYVGCSMSVVHLLDRICSGRRSCQLEVPSFRDIVQPCPRDLITYLDASYQCVIGTRLDCCNSFCYVCMRVCVCVSRLYRLYMSVHNLSVSSK